MYDMPGRAKKGGPLKRGLTWHATRRNPALKSPTPSVPLWARHPVAWVFASLGKLLGYALVIPAVGLRYRRAAPWCLALWLWLAGGVLSLVPHGWSVTTSVAAIAAPCLYWALGLPAWRLTRSALKLELRYRWGILAAVVAGAALLVASAAYPPMLLAPGYWLVWAPLSAWRTGWWGRKPTQEQAGSAPEVDPRVATWDARIAPKLGGAILEDLDALPGGNGWTATINLSNTDKTFDNLTERGLLGFIAGRYKLPITSVSVVPHASGRHDLGQLLVFETNPLQAIQKFQRLSLDPAKGRFVAAVRADGTPGYWQLWIPGWGACHGFIFGVTGAGKSGLLDVIFIEGRHSGVVCTLFGDPHNGKSFPDWMDNVTCFTGKIPRIYLMLAGVERMLEDRKANSGQETYIDATGRTRRRGGGFTPTRDDPMINVALDEWPKIANDPEFGPECVRIVAKIGEDGRKFGVGVTLVSQMPDVDKTGGDRSIRSMLSGTNIAAFRTSDSISGSLGMSMNLPVDPKDLPDKWPDGSTTAGLCLLARDDTPASSARTLFSPGQEHGDELIEWATSGNPAPLPDRLATVGGPLFASWRELLDISDETVVAVAPDGTWIRINDQAASSSEASVKDANERATVWQQIHALLKERSSAGASTNTLVQMTNRRRQTVTTTLTRYQAKGEVHEVNGRWKLGPRPDQVQDAVPESVGAA